MDFHFRVTACGCHRQIHWGSRSALESFVVLFLNFSSRAVIWRWLIYILTVCSNDKQGFTDEHTTITNLVAHALIWSGSQIKYKISTESGITKCCGAQRWGKKPNQTNKQTKNVALLWLVRRWFVYWEKAWVLEPESRSSYIICCAQHKMKMWSPLPHNY